MVTDLFQRRVQCLMIPGGPLLALCLLSACATIDPPGIEDRDAQPIEPPVPTYPAAAIFDQTSGECDVRMDVTPDGIPVDVEAECTDSVFVESAETALSAVRFAPKILDGRKVGRIGVIYPLEYRIE